MLWELKMVLCCSSRQNNRDCSSGRTLFAVCCCFMKKYYLCRAKQERTNLGFNQMLQRFFRPVLFLFFKKWGALIIRAEIIPFEPAM